MRSKAEVTNRYAKAYLKARKKEKGRVLDEVISVTGWSRDNARRRLVAAAKAPPGCGRTVVMRPRKPRAQGYSYDARKVLQRVWAASGGQCGKYLAASMRTQLDALERHGELLPGQGGQPGRGVPPAGHVRGDDRPVPGPGQGPGRDRRRVDDQAVAAAALQHHDPQGRGRGGGRARVLRGRHRRALRPHPEGRVRPHREPDRRPDRGVFTRSVRNNAHTHILAALHAAIGEIPTPSRVSTSTTGPSSSTTRSSSGPRNGRSSSPARGRTRRTTRPPSSPRTTTWCASTASTGATTPRRNAPS